MSNIELNENYLIAFIIIINAIIITTIITNTILEYLIYLIKY